MAFFDVHNIRAVFDYDPLTGVLSWKVRLNSRIVVGSEAGSIDKINGYRVIQVDGKRYQAGRLIWRWMTGEWPAGEIDHKNRDKVDNRFENLRDCSHSQNLCNGFWGTTTSKVKGVNWHPVRRKWQARITKDYKTYYLGLFTDKEEAIAAIQAASVKYHGDFSRLYERN